MPYRALGRTGWKISAIRFDFDAVACAVPGAKRPSQVEENVRAADLPPLSDATMAKIREIYDRRIRPLVHQYW